jgi:ribosomal protein S3AE
MSKLNINFKKSKWKSKSIVDVCLRPTEVFPVDYTTSIVASSESQMGVRTIMTSFQDVGLKSSKDQFIVSKIVKTDEGHDLSPVGYCLDGTTLSLGQRKFKTNTTVITDLKLSDAVYRFEVKLVHTPKLKSTMDLKALRKAAASILESQTQSNDLKTVIGKIALHKFQKDILTILKVNSPELQRFVILKIKKLNVETTKKS